MKKIIPLLLLCSLLQLKITIAQTTSGTEFWLAYMENLNLQFNDQPVFAIHISSEFTSSGSIEVPATGFAQAFTVTAGQQIEVLLPAAIWYSETSEVIEGKGIKITSDLAIEVAATHFRIFFTEATGVLPITELSDDYLLTCYFEEGWTFPSSFVVAATQDDTEVEITSTSFTLGLHPANIPFTVTLNEGDIYQVQALGDLSGSRVRTLNGEKFAVFSGSQQATIGSDCIGSADNQLYEQSQPLDNWSDLYYFVPYKNQGGDVVRILANEADAEVYFDCVLTTVLQPGEFYETKISNATVISSTAAISVTQFNESQSCNASGIGDPTMMQLIATRNQTFRENWRATSGTTGSSSEITLHFSNVIMKTTDIVAIELDGSSIQNEFVPFSADPSLSFAQISVAEGDHALLSSEPFHVYSYGFGDFDAYSKSGNYQQVVDIEYVCLQIEIEGLLCVDSLINFSSNSIFPIASYEWQTTDGQSSIEATPDFTFPSAGTYTATLTAFNTAGESQEASYTFTILDCLELCDDLEPVTIEIELEPCLNFSYQLNYNSNADLVDFEWFFDGQSIGNNMGTTSYIPSLFGTHEISLIALDSDGCEYTASIEIIVYDCNPCDGFSIENLEINGALCIDSILDFSTNLNDPTIDYFWEISSLGSFNSTTVQASILAAGDYSASILLTNSFGCTAEANLEFTIEDCTLPCTNLPPFYIDADDTPCLDETFNAAALIDAMIIDYQWFLNGEPVGENSATYEYNATTIGVYNLTIAATDSDYCEYEASVDFDVSNCTDPCDGFEIGMVNVENSYCANNLITISVSPLDENTSYEWTYGNGQTTTELSFSTTFVSTGLETIILKAFNDDGCTAEEQFDITISNCPVLCSGFYVPNIFSPNQDQINDSFKPLSDCLPDTYLFRVYSRWGGMIFETTDISAAWDGRINGNDAQVGVYTWILEYGFAGQDRVLESGDVLIMR